MIINGVRALRRSKEMGSAEKQPWKEKGHSSPGTGRKEERTGVVLFCAPLPRKPVLSAHPPEGEGGGLFSYQRQLEAHMEMGSHI